MKRALLCMFLSLCMLALTSCAAQTSAPVESTAPMPDHTHTPATADNILPHNEVGYCGNTITKVKAADWESDFWGSDSVTLTDLLRWLDYSEDVCRCMPEYTVTTEMDEEPYGVNLTEGYARHGDKQVSLTDEQVETIRAILDRAKDGTNT